MTIFNESSAVSDAELVGLSLRGDRQSYEAIVERHKGLVCALTYAACGDVHTSEDLAQETFFQAWKHLGELKEPAKLRGWLAGIARNVAGIARRKKLPTAMEGGAMEAMPMRKGDSPMEQAMSREEFGLLWAGLEQLPAVYREPMVLYYRENESVGAVAAAMELSEDAVKQRLARGRAMLAARVEKWMREGLRASVPTKAFTAAGVAGIVGVTVSASAATAGGAMVKGNGGAKGVAMTGGFFGVWLLGPMIVFFTGLVAHYWGYRWRINRAETEEERKELKRQFQIMMAMTIMFAVFLVAWAMGAKNLAPLMGMHAWVWVTYATGIAFAVGLIALAIKHRNRVRRIRARRYAPERM